MKAEQFKDSIFFDSKKCNAALLTIHADGRITVAEHLKPTETAAEVLRIMRETWMADAQSIKIRDQQERIKRLEEALRRIANTDYRGNRSTESQIAFEALKEAKP
jgi:hypothetical protein